MLLVYQLNRGSVSLYFIIVSLCCKDKLLWWGVRTTFVCSYNNKYLKQGKNLFWFSEMVVCSSPVSMASLALGSWQDFQYNSNIFWGRACLCNSLGYSGTHFVDKDSLFIVTKEQNKTKLSCVQMYYFCHMLISLNTLSSLHLSQFITHCMFILNSFMFTSSKSISKNFTVKVHQIFSKG